MNTRVCKVCGHEKDINEFRTIRKIYHAHTCGKCRYLNTRKDIEKVRKYDAEWKRNWRKNNKEKVHEINQKVYHKNRDKYLAQKHEYYTKNRDKILAYNKVYFQTPSGKQKNRNGGSKYEAKKYGATIESVDREVVF